MDRRCRACGDRAPASRRAIANIPATGGKAVLTAAEVADIQANLFPPVRDFVVRYPGFPWHRDDQGNVTAGRIRSSQAIAVEFFSTIKNLTASDQIVGGWMDHLGLHFLGPWTITLEEPVAPALLGERRPTQVDALARGSDGLVLFECKFTEHDGGGCSQWRPIRRGPHNGRRQCNGRYENQTNPVNGVEGRCALTGKGIRYWDWVPRVMAVDADEDYNPCPFRDGRYQWMRNLVVAAALAGNERGRSAFVILYVDDGPFPMARRIQSKEWAEFEALVAGNSVPLKTVSYQTLLRIARESCAETDAPVLEELKRWLDRKFSEVGATDAIGRAANPL
jgi:hypothetical protein